jgi:hypothetical protein
LVEHVYGDFTDNRIYDVSITKFRDRVYFFKRLYNDSGAQD